MADSARDRAIEIVTAELPRGQEYVSPHVVDALLADPAVLRNLLGEAGATDTPADRGALDAIAEACGGRRGDHRDNVVMLVRSMLQDPTTFEARRQRALSVVERLVEALTVMTFNPDDAPGTEALGALDAGREFLRQGGGAGSSAVPAAATTPAGEIEIDGHDLSTALFPAPGQLGNENPSGVILRHAPTGIEVSCSSERSALQNKVQALAELRAVLARRTEETTS